MSVVDPIYPSLWAATLAELGGETSLWEVFADSENFYAGASAELQADEAEKTVRRLVSEGWATLSVRALGAALDSQPTVLSESEAEDAFRRVRRWFTSERQPSEPVPQSLLPIFLDPTERWIAWMERSDR